MLLSTRGCVNIELSVCKWEAASRREVQFMELNQTPERFKTQFLMAFIAFKCLLMKC
jgi:hypothetical protein